MGPAHIQASTTAAAFRTGHTDRGAVSMTADRGAQDSNPSASLQRSGPPLNVPRVAEQPERTGPPAYSASIQCGPADQPRKRCRPVGPGALPSASNTPPAME
jgi:hypothetical protein